MSDKKFYNLVLWLVILGMAVTGALFAYTAVQKNACSIIAYIAGEPPHE